MKSSPTFIVGLIIIALAAACSPASAPSPAAPAEGAADATETPEATPTADLASTGACANLYFPVREGASWTYSGEAGPDGPYSFTDRITAVREDGFTLTADFDGLTRTQEWSCKEEGLVALDYNGGPAGSVATEGLDATFETSDVEGVILPAAVAPGDTWSQSFTLSGSILLPNGTNAMAGGAGQSNFTAVGRESVSVPAGSFEALRVDLEFDLELELQMGDITVPLTLTTTGSTWFVEGLGWVKSTSIGTVYDQPIEETIVLEASSVP